jgi:hypothetical protein
MRMSKRTSRNRGQDQELKQSAREPIMRVSSNPRKASQVHLLHGSGFYLKTDVYGSFLDRSKSYFGMN